MRCEVSRDIDYCEKSHENRSWEQLTTVARTVPSTPGIPDLKTVQGEARRFCLDVAPCHSFTTDNDIKVADVFFLLMSLSLKKRR